MKKSRFLLQIFIALNIIQLSETSFSQTADPANSQGAVLVSPNGHRRVFIECDQKLSNDECESFQIIVQNMNSEKVVRFEDRFSIKKLPDVLANQVEFENLSINKVVTGVTWAPFAIVIIPIASIENLMNPQWVNQTPLSVLLIYSGKSLEKVTQFIFALPITRARSAIIHRQLNSLFTKMLNPRLQGQILESRLLSYFDGPILPAVEK